MKKQLIFLFALCMGIHTGFSQDLISAALKPNQSTPAVERILKTNPRLKSFQVVNINLSETGKAQSYITAIGKRLPVTRTRLEKRGEHQYSWFGKTDDGLTDVLLTVNGKSVHGVVVGGGISLKLETMEGMYVMLDEIVDPKHKNFCGTASGTADPAPVSPGTALPQQQTHFTPKTLELNLNCGPRVLVMYTTAAHVKKPDIDGYAQHCIDQLNQTFANSDINSTAQIAAVMPAFYTEDDEVEENLERLVTPGDGDIDLVFEYMDKYSADICILLTDSEDPDGTLGKAYSIKSCAGSAFAVVDVTFAGDPEYFTFSHEIGHIFGCRHELDADASTVPYAYGHGYRYTGNAWCTVMALNLGESRIMYWSNPDVSYGGQPTGNTTTANEARVINENLANVMSFRNEAYTRLVYQTNIDEHLIYNAGNVHTSSTVVLPSGDELSLFAGNQVKMGDGFKASIGSAFLAKITPGCGTPDLLTCDYEPAFDTYYGTRTATAARTTAQPTETRVFPNPSAEVIHIVWYQPSEQETVIRLLNMQGEAQEDIAARRFSAGNQQVDHAVSTLKPGMYLIEIAAGGSKNQYIKFIKL